MDHQRIFAAARESGCSDHFIWTIRPDVFATRLLAASKRYARFLKDANLAKSHSEALGTVAKAGGFEHWHAYSTALQNILSSVDPNGNPAKDISIEGFTKAFVLMAKTASDCPPKKDEEAALKRVAIQLAAVSDSSEIAILDMIGKMNGSDSWQDLVSRRPEQSKKPLYVFSTDYYGIGRFEISSACEALIKEQDRYLQNYHERPDEQKKEFVRWLNKVLDARPDFLEGQLARAEILRYELEFRHEQKKILTEAIAQANALIPRDFNGQIPWHAIENRFYHRLLYGAMVSHSLLGESKKALALAKRQLKINEEDSLGIRFWLPVLLVAAGKFDAIDNACKKMTMKGQDADAVAEMVLAVCHLAKGNYQKSAQSLYSAVFKYPPTKHIVTGDLEALQTEMHSREFSRVSMPDVETMIDHLLCASFQLLNMYEIFEGWIGHPGLAKAEKKMAKLFRSSVEKSRVSFETWFIEVDKMAEILSRDTLPD